MEELEPYHVKVEVNTNNHFDYNQWYQETSPKLIWRNHRWILVTQGKEFSSLRHAKVYMKSDKNRVLLPETEWSNIQFKFTRKQT